MFTDVYINVNGAPSGLRQFLETKSSLKMMKNTFHFTLKALFFLKYLNFCLELWVMYKKSLIRKIRLISKFVEQQFNVINI